MKPNRLTLRSGNCPLILIAISWFLVSCEKVPVPELDGGHTVLGKIPAREILMDGNVARAVSSAFEAFSQNPDHPAADKISEDYLVSVRVLQDGSVSTLFVPKDIFEDSRTTGMIVIGNPEMKEVEFRVNSATGQVVRKVYPD